MSHAPTTTGAERGQPFCPEGDARFWASVGAGAVLVLSVGCLIGMRALFRGSGAEDIGIVPRISAVLANMVWVVLCTGAGWLAVTLVARVRDRPPGALLDIASRAFYCVAVANLVHLLPWQGDRLKLAIDAAAFLVSVTLLACTAFRVRMLDAAAAVAIAFGAVAALTTVAYAIVWAVLPA